MIFFGMARGNSGLVCRQLMIRLKHALLSFLRVVFWEDGPKTDPFSILQEWSSSVHFTQEYNDRHGYITNGVPCRGTAPNLSLDLDARRQTHLFWDAREVAAEGSETSLRESRAFSASVPLYPATQSPSGVGGVSIVERLMKRMRPGAIMARVSA